LDSGTGTMAPVASYAYDALGRRISKSVFSTGLPAVTEFVFDGDSVIEERVSGAVTASFVLDGSRSQDDGVVRTFTWTQTSGPFRFTTQSGSLTMRRAGQDYYFHTDDQGNVLALSGANGAVVERYDHDDYGAVTFLTSDGVPTSATTSSVGNVYCWGGLRLDAESGLFCNDGGGYFEPTSGRSLGQERKINVSEAKPMAPRSMSGGAGNNPWAGDSPTAKFIYVLEASKRIGSSNRQSSPGNNPWTGGSPVEMKTGTVKFFNETKSFGFARLLESIQDESKGFSSLIR
jgi:hypothetical protein